MPPLNDFPSVTVLRTTKNVGFFFTFSDNDQQDKYVGGMGELHAIQQTCYVCLLKVIVKGITNMSYLPALCNGLDPPLLMFPARASSSFPLLSVPIAETHRSWLSPAPCTVIDSSGIQWLPLLPPWPVKRERAAAPVLSAGSRLGLGKYKGGCPQGHGGKPQYNMQDLAHLWSRPNLWKAPFYRES